MNVERDMGRVDMCGFMNIEVDQNLSKSAVVRYIPGLMSLFCEIGCEYEKLHF